MNTYKNEIQFGIRWNKQQPQQMFASEIWKAKICKAYNDRYTEVAEL